jgi:hypothetical protein
METGNYRAIVGYQYYDASHAGWRRCFAGWR